MSAKYSGTVNPVFGIDSTSYFSYISTTLDEKIENLVSEKREQAKTLRVKDYEGKIAPKHDDWPTTVEISRMESDRRNWRYSLNIRGFILYILGEIELQQEDHKIHNKRIEKVLQNLSEHHLRYFPFLMYYDEFKNAYETLALRGKVQKKFQVELLKNIAQELRFQIHTADDGFLEYWVTKRYSEEITFYFIAASRLAGLEYEDLEDLDEFLTHLSLEKLIQYQKNNLQVMKEYLERENENIEGALGMDDVDFPRMFPSLYFS
ncbi:MAG: hypothetical protein DLM72_15800 [Candidatus Nitrosopolaris wilkensis]|nr:MAG: hypothetical protein DLM72_15800 [Candidatus Nitrosopolaris wilkensis]